MKHFLISSLAFFSSWQLNIQEPAKILTIANFTYGKTGCSVEEKNYVSKKFAVPVKQLSSSIYFSSDASSINPILINDKTFNYSYFGDNEQQITGPAKLEVKTYFYKGKLKYFAIRIRRKLRKM